MRTIWNVIKFSCTMVVFGLITSSVIIMILKGLGLSDGVMLVMAGLGVSGVLGVMLALEVS